MLERYPYLSVAKDAKNADGTTNFVEDVINGRSEYIHWVGFDSDYTTARGNGMVDSGDDFDLV